MKQFPDINEIKLLEKNSQKNGSGILYEELLGIWKFKYVWGKESDEIKNIPSSVCNTSWLAMSFTYKYFFA